MKTRHRFTSFFLLACALHLCDPYPRASAADKSTTKPDAATAKIQEIPLDGVQVGAAIGLFLRRVEVRYPRNLKLSIFQRIYNQGVLDKARSSIQVHATTVPISQDFIDLGFLDPDTLTGAETRRMKVIGVGPYWVELPEGLPKGGSIDANPPGDLPAGREHPLLDLCVGLPPSGSVVFSQGPEKAIMRVTIHVRLDPLSATEEAHLRKYPNYNAAFKLEK